MGINLHLKWGGACIGVAATRQSGVNKKQRLKAPLPIVSYRSGACPVWIKVRNPGSIAVQRERSENWNR